MDVTQIIVAFIGIIALILTGIIIPLVKAKTSKSEWETIMIYARAIVSAAEVIYGSKAGQQKLKYAVEHIKAICEEKGIKIDEESIRVAIENAWKDLQLDHKEA